MTTILLLGAKSKDDPLESVPAELSRLKQLFTASPQVDLSIEYEPYLTRSVLGEQLRNLTNQVSILHFAGHSGAEALQTDEELVYAQHIATILQTWQQKPCLLFLNGCNSGGQAELFLEAGVSCVVATHNYINDKLAALFAHEFYANLLVDPSNVTLEQAMTRAGALTLMGENRAPRTFNFGASAKKNTKSWDWDIFTRDAALPTNWTFSTLQDICSQTITTTSSSSMDFITKAKLEALQNRWQRLLERHTAIEQQYDLETRIEEELRIKYILDQSRADMNAIEKEISELQP